MAHPSTPLIRSAEEEARPGIAVPGRNCWRVAHARRVSFLIDGAAYFSAFKAAVTRAQRSILILGWDIDSRTRLEPQHPPGGDLPDELGPFLDAIVRRNHALHAHVLDWDFSMIYALERERLPLVKLGWNTHRRVHFKLDGDHPTTASHHQKIVVVDDRVGFSGGLDLTTNRWDTPFHVVNDPSRRNANGDIYTPFHDLQMMVDDDAAIALGDICRDRWERLTGQHLKRVRVEEDPWPPEVVPDVEDVDVMIARTDPAFDGRPEVREVEALYLDSIAAARRSIFIENQYFTSALIADALGARLEERDGPEIVIVGPCECSGWLEQSTMGVLRDRFVRRLQEHDRHGRLGFYYPAISGKDTCKVFIHSNVMVVDDAILRIGSANLSNRSMGFDTECDVAIESRGEARIERAIARFRKRLLSEHLGVPPARVDEAIESTGSLLRAVESLRTNERSLEPVALGPPSELDGFIPEKAVFDPERPIDPEELVAEMLPDDLVTRSKRHPRKFILLLVALLLLGAAWRWTPLRNWITPARVAEWTRPLHGSPFAPLIVASAYVVATLAMIPHSLLVLETSILFGPFVGFAYAFLGSMLSAAVAYVIGRVLGRDIVRRVAGPRLNRLCRRLAKRGALAVASVRLVPIAPFTIVNLVAGAARIGFRDFLLGTLIGTVPGTFLLSLFGHHLAEAVRRPGSTRFVLVAAALAAIILAGSWLSRRLLRERKTPASSKASRETRGD